MHACNRLTEDDLHRAFRQAEAQRYLPSVMVVSPKMYRRYWWQLHKTHLDLDWAKALFPRSTVLRRWVARKYFAVQLWRWRRRNA